MTHNPVCYWELASHDAEKTAAFLRALFDWEITLDPRTGIFEAPAGEARAAFTGGGVFTLRRARLPFLTLYIRVDDVDAKAKQAEALGGLIVIPPFNIDSASRICLFNEPSGVTLALIGLAIPDQAT